MGRSKYRSKKTWVDGICFDSKKEAKRYTDLKWMVKARVIRDLELQPKYPICVKQDGDKLLLGPEGEKMMEYRADFRYTIVENGEVIVEDVKGFRTQTYKTKKKFVERVYGIKITEL